MWLRGAGWSCPFSWIFSEGCDQQHSRVYETSFLGEISNQLVTSTQDPLDNCHSSIVMLVHIGSDAGIEKVRLWSSVVAVGLFWQRRIPWTYVDSFLYPSPSTLRGLYTFYSNCRSPSLNSYMMSQVRILILGCISIDRRTSPGLYTSTPIRFRIVPVYEESNIDILWYVLL